MIDEKKTRFHEWINSLGVVIALMISGVSAYLSWQGLQLKYESIGFSAQPTNVCKVVYAKLGDAGELGVCWLVTLTNQSENRLSIVRASVFSVISGVLVYSSGFQEIETVSGQPAMLPITLDGGEAKTFVIRAPVGVSPAVKQAIESLPEASDPITLGTLMKYLAKQKLDFVGNSLKLISREGQIIGWSVQTPVKQAISVLKVETGRGATFTTQFSWPPVGPGL